MLKTFNLLLLHYHRERITVSQIAISASNKVLVSLILIIMVVASVIDTSIIKLSVFTGSLNFAHSIIVYSILILIFGIGQYFILSFVKTRIEITKIRPISTVHRIVTIIQYVLLSSFVIIIIQMALTSSYNLLLLEVMVCTSCGLSIGILGFLSKKFFSWYRARRGIIVLLYAIAMGVISVNICFMIFVVIYGLAPQEDTIRPIRNPIAAVINAENVFNTIYVMSSIISFILIWVATVLLLRYYSLRLGMARYWIIVSAPLLYFLSQYQALFFNLFDTFRLADPTLFGITFTLIFGMSKPLGGILFGIAFWVVSRKVRKHVIKYYLIVSAFGLILLFTSNQATSLIFAPYPPFGLVTVSLLGLSSYMLLVGIFSSAMSISRDAELRRFVRQVASKEIEWLESIGSAEMEQDLISKVIPMVQHKAKSIVDETGINTSLTDLDIKKYLDEVIAEVRNYENKG